MLISFKKYKILHLFIVLYYYDSVFVHINVNIFLFCFEKI